MNTGESRNWGVEAEILAEPVENLRIDFSLGYQNYKVTDLGTVGRLVHHGAGHRAAIRRSAATSCTRRARRSGTWG